MLHLQQTISSFLKGKYLQLGDVNLGTRLRAEAAQLNDRLVVFFFGGKGLEFPGLCFSGMISQVQPQSIGICCTGEYLHSLHVQKLSYNFCWDKCTLYVNRYRDRSFNQPRESIHQNFLLEIDQLSVVSVMPWRQDFHLNDSIYFMMRKVDIEDAS